MAHLMATQSVLDFGSRLAQTGRLLASLVDCIPGWMSMAVAGELGSRKGFYRYEFNFRTNSPFPLGPEQPPIPAAADTRALRADADVLPAQGT